VAEHMAAPATAAHVKNTLANPEPSTHGPGRHLLRCSKVVVVRAIRLSKLNDNEVAEVTAETLRGYERAERAAINRVYRRRQRPVTSPA
jgi:hypothetical protein